MKRKIFLCLSLLSLIQSLLPAESSFKLSLDQIDSLKDKIKEKNNGFRGKLAAYMFNFYPNKESKDITRLYNEHTEALEDFYKNENHLILLAKTKHQTTQSPITTTQRYFYDVYNKEDQAVLSFALPSILKTVDTFTAYKDNTVFFTIGTNKNDEKVLIIQTKYDALFDEEWDNKRKSTSLGVLAAWLNPTPKEISQVFESSDAINLEKATYIGIEYISSGKLLLLKMDETFFTIDISNLPCIQPLLKNEKFI
jgi:hypothetical protein